MGTRKYINLFAGEYELIEVERFENNELTDFVLAREVRTGDMARISSSIVVRELLRGNIIFKED